MYPELQEYNFDWTKSYDLAFVLFIGIIVIAIVGQFFNPPPRVKAAEVPKTAVV